MCGICGIFRFDGSAPDPSALAGMNAALAHRGPDGEGMFSSGPSAIAMRRLAIIDLAGGDQPIFNEDGRFAAVVNGEIYNYVELREELRRRGHQFKTGSDVEVVLHLYEEEGARALGRLNGMFAIALVDTLTGEMIVARDRLGIKPLYYLKTGQELIFSSDLRSLLTHPSASSDVSLDSFLLYVGFAFVPEPASIMSGISKVRPGHYLKISKAGVEEKRYWTLEEKVEPVDPAEAAERVLGLLSESARIQMRSDVPVGVFLSGGFDSSLVAALAAKHTDAPLRTFAVGYEGHDYDERPFARMVSKHIGSDHTELALDPGHLLDHLPRALDCADEPFADTAVLATFLLSEHARDAGVKVVLSGSGGDEIFAGYSRYLPNKLAWRVLNDTPAPMRRAIAAMVSAWQPDRARRIASPALGYACQISGLNLSLAAELLGREVVNDHLVPLVSRASASILESDGRLRDVSARMRFDVQQYLPGNLLAFFDRMTMGVSIEGRVPLLDHYVVEAMFAMPLEARIPGRRPKGFIKDAARHLLPAEIIDRPKRGFNAPVEHWLTSRLRPILQRLLIDEPSGFGASMLDRTATAAALRNEGYPRAAQTLYTLLVFDLWYRRVVSGQRITRLSELAA